MEPYQSIRYCFPITSDNSQNAILTLLFLYIPKIFRPIRLNDITPSYLHVWATYTPSISKYDNQIEIEILQVSTLVDKNSKIGYFYNLNSFHSWESVGYSSSTSTFFGPTGFTPVRTFFLDRLSEKVNFFIVNVSNYSGVVTLNFVAEEKWKEEYLDDKFCISVGKEKSNSIGTVKTVGINVEPNKRYCAPVYLYYEKKLINSIFEIDQFQNFTTHNFHSKSDFTDQICSEIPFDSSIIEVAAHEIQHLRNVNLKKTFVLPSNEQISLQKVFKEFNLQPRFKIRFYINGSTTNTTGACAYTNFWKPYFKVFNKKTGHLCPEISKPLLKEPSYHFRTSFDNSQIPIQWHTYVDVDLDEIGIDKSVIFYIKCRSALKTASSPGSIGIARVDGKNETLLFRNQIYEDSDMCYCRIMLGLEFVNDSWYIRPVKYCFTKKKKLDIIAEALFRNNWVVPELLLQNIDDMALSSSSNDEVLLDEIETANSKNLK